MYLHVVSKNEPEPEPMTSSQRFSARKIAAIVVLAVVAWIFSLYVLYVLLSGFFQVIASL